MINNHEFWVWLLIGTIPYRITWEITSGGVRNLELKALFWRLNLKLRPSGRYDWMVCVPLIERLRYAIWAVVERLQDKET